MAIAQEDVCLVLRTFPKHNNAANFDPEASGEWVKMKLGGAAQVAAPASCEHAQAQYTRLSARLGIMIARVY